MHFNSTDCKQYSDDLYLGSGTYDDPVTIATAPGELNKCEIVYLPFLTKYGRVEDYCAQCGTLTTPNRHHYYTILIGHTDTDWKNGQPHIDIWTGSNRVNGGQNQINCENRLTPGGRYSIVRDPPKNYGVNSTCLWRALYILWCRFTNDEKYRRSAVLSSQHLQHAKRLPQQPRPLLGGLGGWLCMDFAPGMVDGVYSVVKEMSTWQSRVFE